MSDDPAYGFSPDNPIRVGPITARGAHLFYLNSLRGQNGEPVEYERTGACCSFDDASLPMGGGLIDVYKISIDGRTDALTLFVDMYRKGPPKIPAGFTQRPYGPITQPSPNSELSAVLQKLSATATSEQFNQIKNAINASPALLAQLNDLSSSGNLTAIRVSTPDAIPMIQGIRFGAIREGSQFVFSSILLQELLKNRIHDAGKESDILPDNTVFVLSHLAYHARTTEEMARLDNQTKNRIDELLIFP